MGVTAFAMKLYTYAGNKNAYKALIAAEYVGAKIEIPEFKMGVDNKTPEFLKKKNPHGKVPVLETDKGCVFESNAIARYVARLSDVGLFGSNLQETALVEQWIDFMSNEVDAPLLSWGLPLMGIWPYDKKKEQGAITAVKTALAILNDHLLENTVLVGETITLADIIAVCNLYHGFTKLFDADFRKDFPNVERYFMTMVNQPSFKKVIGDVTLCTEQLKYTPPKKDGKKESAKPAEKKPAEEKPKKEEKVKPWYDLLPPTNMQLDGWKRLYSNAPANNFREVCIKRLWEGGPVPASLNDEVFPGYDHDGYSMWFCEYKYPEENTVNFMVMNKINGFLQRVDFARKYAFGVMCILKDAEGRFPVKGVWIFRGPDIPQQMIDESYDLELFTLTKVDLSDPAQKKTVEDMICEEEKIDGLECIDCKIFK